MKFDTSTCHGIKFGYYINTSKIQVSFRAQTWHPRTWKYVFRRERSLLLWLHSPLKVLKCVHVWSKHHRFEIFDNCSEVSDWPSKNLPKMVQKSRHFVYIINKIMRLLVRNQVEHEKRNAISTRTHVLSSIPQSCCINGMSLHPIGRGAQNSCILVVIVFKWSSKFGCSCFQARNTAYVKRVTRC